MSQKTIQGFKYGMYWLDLYFFGSIKDQHWTMRLSAGFYSFLLIFLIDDTGQHIIWYIGNVPFR